MTQLLRNNKFSMSILLAIALQIGIFAFGYGKLVQKVDDLARRLDHVERILNRRGGK